MFFYDPAQKQCSGFTRILKASEVWYRRWVARFIRAISGNALPFPTYKLPPTQIVHLDRKDLHRAVTLSDARFYVAIIHSQNTSPKNCDGSYWSTSDANVRELLTGDFDFYRELFGPAKNTITVAPQSPQPATFAAVQTEILPATDCSPKVSCILATGNRTGFTRQAIRCFLRQTMDDSELIVVDDGRRISRRLVRGSVPCTAHSD
jgi:hypothetical protein